MKNESISSGSATTTSADSVTFEDIKRAMDQMRLFGMPIHSSPIVPEEEPKQKLSLEVEVSPEFRKQMDVWLDEFFGRKRVFWIIGQSMIITHPANLRYFEEAIKAGVLDLSEGEEKGGAPMKKYNPPQLEYPFDFDCRGILKPFI